VVDGRDENEVARNTHRGLSAGRNSRDQIAMDNRSASQDADSFSVSKSDPRVMCAFRHNYRGTWGVPLEHWAFQLRTKELNHPIGLLLRCIDGMVPKPDARLQVMSYIGGDWFDVFDCSINRTLD